MTITIHGGMPSRAIRPLWAAAELGVAVNNVPTPFLGGATRTPEFLALNPNGHIPVLIDHRPEGDVVVWESMACVHYLVRWHAHDDMQGIAPRGPAEDADALRWSFWAMTEFETDALTVMVQRLFMPPERRKPELADAAEQRLRAPLAVLEDALAAAEARGRGYLAAERFTVADLCVASIAAWLQAAPRLLVEFPVMAGWRERCLSRPAFAPFRTKPSLS